MLLRSPASRCPGTAVAVYSPGHLGDILHTIPLLRTLKSNAPEQKIIWMVGAWSLPLADRYRDAVDDLIVFSPQTRSLTRHNHAYRQSIATQWRILRGLRKQRVDILIGTLGSSPAERWIANTLRPRHWIGIADTPPPRIQSGIHATFIPYQKHQYEAQFILELAQPLGFPVGSATLEYTTTPDEQAAAIQNLAAAGLDPARPFIVLSPGSGWPGKNWPVQRYAALASWLAQNQNQQVAIIGSETEKALAQRMVPAEAAAIFNLAGTTSIPVLAATLEKAALFIGNDSGPLHLAAAVDTPTISLWGPTAPEKWAPRGDRHHAIHNMQRCAGCAYWDITQTCLQPTHRCMEAISLKDVQQAFEKWRHTAYPDAAT